MLMQMQFINFVYAVNTLMTVSKILIIHTFFNKSTQFKRSANSILENPILSCYKQFTHKNKYRVKAIHKKKPSRRYTA